MSRVYPDDDEKPGDDDNKPRDLASSSATFPTDSENYSSSSPAHDDLSSPSPRPSSQSSPMILYSPPTIWGLLRGAAINILLPFVNGLMLGLGELLAHEAAWRLGWEGTKVSLLLQLGLRSAIEGSCGGEGLRLGGKSWGVLPSAY